jgi:hypothetical protein
MPLSRAALPWTGLRSASPNRTTFKRGRVWNTSGPIPSLYQFPDHRKKKPGPQADIVLVQPVVCGWQHCTCHSLNCLRTRLSNIESGFWIPTLFGAFIPWISTSK